MAIFGVERKAPTPIEKALNDLAKRGNRKMDSRGGDGTGITKYIEEGFKYLTLARSSDLDGIDVVASCWDLAATVSTDGYSQFDRRANLAVWNELVVQERSRLRGTRTIDFNLDPQYFYQILVRDKSFEGRAFVPNSPKKYTDIKKGDIIRFTLQSREFWHGDEAKQLGLTVGMQIQVNVGRVLFSPTAHGMYETHGIDGSLFQPHLTNDKDVSNLQTVATYMRFPNYRKLILSHGFVGIEVLEPKLIG